MTRVLVVGTPRSGSTWTAEILGRAAGADMVHEPDNAALHANAAPVTRARGLFPVIAPGEVARDYQALWDLGFAGGWPKAGLPRIAGRTIRRLPPQGQELILRTVAPAMRHLRPRPRHVVAKSVYATFTVEWLAAQYGPRILVVERDPLNVTASWLDLELPFGDLDRSQAVAKLSPILDIPAPDPTGPLHRRVAWGVAFLMVAMRHTAAAHPDWLIVNHAALSAEPQREFKRVFAAMGLEWTPAVDEHIHASNRPGSGFSTVRVRGELADAWRRRLTASQASDIQAVVAQFPGLS